MNRESRQLGLEEKRESYLTCPPYVVKGVGLGVSKEKIEVS